ncbi:hypothetical protein AVEN_54335-1 [Araneus ventricosus]|uniref:Ig-like domain-containing protein n=1 Tax=Araneus ventricosus TaxID=182803 RepID=A0A4Y2GE71_ARAVE|nr:hypothetical protein AVEN_54335-1 [Araneus ventricosus]
MSCTDGEFFRFFAVPLSLEVGSNVTSAALHSAVTLSCVAMSYPRATVTWSRDVPWPPGSVLIKTDALSHVRVLSTVTISALRRQDNGTYYCAARNDQDMLMAQQDVVVLAHSWYRSEGPGAAIRFKGDRKDQTALARLSSDHLKTLRFSRGDKKFNICTKYNMIEAIPQHLLDCVALVYDDLLKRPDFLLEVIKANDLVDLILKRRIQS